MAATGGKKWAASSGENKNESVVTSYCVIRVRGETGRGPFFLLLRFIFQFLSNGSNFDHGNLQNKEK